MAKEKNQTQRPQRKPISRPSLSQTVTLNTPCAQRVYNRVFSEVVRNLYSLGVITHVLSNDDSTADELNEIVKSRFDSLKEKLDDEVKRLNTVRDDAGVTAIPGYTEPQSIENDVTSPMAFHFINLLQTLDKVVTLLDSLWLTEEIDVKQKLRMEYMWQKRLLKFSNQLRELNNRARKASKGNSVEVKSDNTETADAKDIPEAMPEEEPNLEIETEEPSQIAAVG
jgi:hypothetical protein